MSSLLSFATFASGVGGFVLTALVALPRIGLFLLPGWVGDDPAQDPDRPNVSLRPCSADATRGAQSICALAVSALALVAPGSTAWSKDKPTRFWNLTGETVTHLSIAVAGTGAYGPDQCRNDRDGTVDYDERLPITGIGPGRYDLLLDLKKGRRCRVKDVEIRQGEVFSVEEKDLGDCTP